jgi:CheY-like chemotaxis protein
MGQAQQNRRAVLIVEDDAELRGFAARLLEDGELDTIECESAEAALATMLIRGRDVAMIFADIQLSGASGYGSFRCCGRLGGHRRIMTRP